MILLLILAGALAALSLHLIMLKLTSIHRLYIEDITIKPSNFDWPDLSVIFAARNEEKRIAQAVHSMAAIDYPNLRIVAVDDRSTDSTGSILDQITLNNQRVRVV